ncbi:hypothetical protein Xinn_00874 [Xenorhabdus innexi]|uniref:Transposase n=1 Tax=Xenorhabdus innexi TaxID=290109 RepID=A0A2G0NS07_9GAMM|nr:hypothetical protein Xinn_00874 [Xenorhabdus innexi]
MEQAVIINSGKNESAPRFVELISLNFGRQIARQIINRVFFKVLSLVIKNLNYPVNHQPVPGWR